MTTTTAQLIDPAVPAAAPGPGRWRRTLRSRRLVAGLAVLLLFALAAVIGPFLVGDPNAVSTDLNQGPSAAHWLGTTQLGQDVLAQLVVSARGTLFIGVAAALVASVVSIVIGIGGGFLGGLADEALSLISNVFLVIPGLPLVIVVSAYAKGGGMPATVLIIALTSWAASARVLRAQTLSLRSRDYVLAARVYGESRWRIVLVEILPNELAIIVSQFIFAVVFAILTQAGLAFLGLENPLDLTWGNMLYFAENAEALSSGYWWWFVPPGVCIAAVGAALSLVNFGLDELLNPRLRVYHEPKQKRGRNRDAREAREAEGSA